MEESLSCFSRNTQLTCFGRSLLKLEFPLTTLLLDLWLISLD